MISDSEESSDSVQFDSDTDDQVPEDDPNDRGYAGSISLDTFCQVTCITGTKLYIGVHVTADVWVQTTNMVKGL